MQETLINISIVLVLSIVQAVFGTGILVFGTPAFLIIGNQYEDILALLLPASFTVSFLQLKKEGLPEKINKYIIIFAIVGLLFGIALNKFLNSTELNIFVMCLLVLAVIIKSYVRTYEEIETKIEQYKYRIIMLISIIHGVCNMGGLFLTLYFTSIHKTKKNIRNSIACIYIIFVTIQMLTIETKRISINLEQILLYPLVVFLTYKYIGGALYNKINQFEYSRWIDVLFYFFIICIILKTLIKIA